jgi:hypothetical protein
MRVDPAYAVWYGYNTAQGVESIRMRVAALKGLQEMSKKLYKLKRVNIKIFSNEKCKQTKIIFNEKKTKPTKRNSHTILKKS